MHVYQHSIKLSFKQGFRIPWNLTARISSNKTNETDPNITRSIYIEQEEDIL